MTQKYTASQINRAINILLDGQHADPLTGKQVWYIDIGDSMDQEHQREVSRVLAAILNEEDPEQ